MTHSDLDEAIRARLREIAEFYREIGDPAVEVRRVPVQTLTGTLLAVIDLHKPYRFVEDAHDSCWHCSDEEGEARPYPCPTVRALARGLGVPDPKETT